MVVFFLISPPLVLGKYLCLQNLVGWQPWRRMSFIYLQEIWLQTLFHLNSFRLFQQLSGKKSIFTGTLHCALVTFDCHSAEVSVQSRSRAVPRQSLAMQPNTGSTFALPSWSQVKCWMFILREAEEAALSLHTAHTPWERQTFQSEGRSF